MGYAGGTKPNPTYFSIGDHTEAFQVDYDPERISYEELVELFWKSHRPSDQSFSTQYQTVLFYANAEQERIAIASRDRVAEGGGRVLTRVEPLRSFYQAEDYHQKYYLRSNPRLRDYYTSIYPDADDLMNSTAVARVNGYLAGYGTRRELEAEAERLGLTQAVLDQLLERVRERR